ncbi:MAG: helix-turn-helix domain containing protein [Ferruginibacter sp.]|nr:helix-turn-helix domain containing protein [Cytophagales bacterium]
MRYIELTSTEELTLQEAVRNHPNALFRQRSQALLLSHRNYGVPELARLYQVRTRTLYEWFSRWQSIGLVGLRITKGRGRKPILLPEHIPLVVDALRLDCQNLQQASVEVSQQVGALVSKGQVKRFLKSSATVGDGYGNGSKTSKTR